MNVNSIRKEFSGGLRNHGAEDICYLRSFSWIDNLRIEPSTLTKTEIVRTVAVSVFPNPSNGIIQIEGDWKGVREYAVYSIFGEIVARVIRVLTTTSMDVVDGEMLDVDFEKRSDIDEEDYFEMIGKKTGALFSALSRLLSTSCTKWDRWHLRAKCSMNQSGGQLANYKFCLSRSIVMS